MIIAMFDSDGTFVFRPVRSRHDAVRQVARTSRQSRMYFTSLVPEGLLARFVPVVNEHFQRR
jgi:hypothetical protein